MERKLLLVNCILCFSPYSISYDKQIIRKNPFRLCVYTSRPGKKKTRQNRKLLARKFCDLEGKIKKYIEDTIPHWGEICPAGGKFCPACGGNKHFFQAWGLEKGKGV